MINENLYPCELFLFQRPAWPWERHITYCDGFEHMRYHIAQICTQDPTNNKRFLVTLGQKGTITLFHTFNVPSNSHYIARMMNDAKNLHPSMEIILSAPLSFEQEVDLLKKKNINYILMRDSGHKRSYQKVKAAHKCHVHILMLKRPCHKLGKKFSSITSILEQL